MTYPTGLGLPAGDTALVGMVSLDYGKTMQWRGRGALNAGDRQTLAQVAAAHLASPGRLVRAFNVPPVAAVYQLLLRAGVDLIGTKDLKQTAEILGRLRRDPPLRSE